MSAKSSAHAFAGIPSPTSPRLQRHSQPGLRPSTRRPTQPWRDYDLLVYKNYQHTDGRERTDTYIRQVRVWRRCVCCACRCGRDGVRGIVFHQSYANKSENNGGVSAHPKDIPHCILVDTSDQRSERRFPGWRVRDVSS